MAKARVEVPRWYQCEDCMGTGHNCGCFNGQRPDNEAADAIVLAEAERRSALAYEHARRMLDDYEDYPEDDE